MLKQLINDKVKDRTLAPNEMIVPLIPTSSVIVGPYMATSMDMYKGKLLNAINSVSRTSRLVVIVDKINDTEEPTLYDVRPVGTLCDIKGIMRFAREVTRVSTEGRSRVIIKEIFAREPILSARVEVIDYFDREYTIEERAYCHILRDRYEKLNEIRGKPDEKIFETVDLKIPDDGCDYILANTQLTCEEHYSVLEELDTMKRLKKLIEYIDMALRTAQLDVEIETKIAASFASEQKARYLREKKEVIERELGEDAEEEVDDYRKRIEALPIAEEYKQRLLKELFKYTGTAPGSQEASVTLNYFDLVLDLPWPKGAAEENPVNFDMNEAKGILEADHYGLQKVKERISEYLAVLKLTKSMKSPIICLVGPPGVGKTSIAKSVARATNREFTRLSLGGMHDEAEIRGHRKTYVGAMPGRIISGLRQVGTTETVFLLDEIDKLSKDYKGDPASALLEVLDPEQNSTFMDNYVEIPFDLSPVMFITTANNKGDIPEPLLDRLEVIDIDGYLPDEKLEIAKRHLLAKQLALNGITSENLNLTDGIIEEIITSYTREAGVRQLERNIANLCRKAAMIIVTGEGEKLEVTSEKLREYLGAKVHNYDTMKDIALIGTVNGLAWTSVGGCILPLEAAYSPGKGGVEITGHLGDVMKESARAAIGYIKTNSEKYGIPTDMWDKININIHAPEGAVPKDGPSAGVTLATVIISALTQKPVSQIIAMTGEITLTGRVLPIGGLREKLYAALRSGVKRVIIPKENEEDLIDVPAQFKENLEIAFARNYDDVYKFVYGDLPCEPEGSALGSAPAESANQADEKTEKITESPSAISAESSNQSDDKTEKITESSQSNAPNPTEGEDDCLPSAKADGEAKKAEISIGPAESSANPESLNQAVNGADTLTQ
ncbi:MAG: endopeptidase La [Eubacteriaceae bacterium]|nr:endopeptidase La [Eubacteriaceae bacterium]